MPQVHAPGVGRRRSTGARRWSIWRAARSKVHLFLMRPCFSGAAFCDGVAGLRPSRRFWRGTSRRSSGSAAVFAEVRYDNLSSAVKQVLRGRRRVETDRFVALRSHYLFESQFTTPGMQGAHEKGGVEGEVGRFRRNHLVPVPSVGSIWPS